LILPARLLLRLAGAALGWRCRLWWRRRAARTEKSFKEALFTLRRWRRYGLRSLHATAATCHLPAVVGFRFYVRCRSGAGHLGASVFTRVGRIRWTGLVLPFGRRKTVFEFDRFMELEGIRVIRWLQPRELGIESPLLHREGALEDALRDRRCDNAAAFAMTATAYFGLSYGAKQANHAMVSLFPSVIACAEPVLPATTTFGTFARLPVPPASFTTFQSPCRASSIWSRVKSVRRSPRTFGWRGTTYSPLSFMTGLPSGVTTSCTRRGW
jgi:hypothetical protein